MPKSAPSAAEVRAILAKGEPIRQRLVASLSKLQRDIWAVYTPEQQAWITSRGRGDAGCRDDVLETLSSEQVTAIRNMKAAFAESVKGYRETIQTVNAEARAAAQAGASREEVRRILTRADAAVESLQGAERRLAAAILDVLTPGQRRNGCLVRALVGR